MSHLYIIWKKKSFCFNAFYCPYKMKKKKNGSKRMKVNGCAYRVLMLFSIQNARVADQRQGHQELHFMRARMRREISSAFYFCLFWFLNREQTISFPYNIRLRSGYTTTTMTQVDRVKRFYARFLLLLTCVLL